MMNYASGVEGRAAQPARAADAAVRPQDRWHFKIWLCAHARTD